MMWPAVVYGETDGVLAEEWLFCANVKLLSVDCHEDNVAQVAPFSNVAYKSMRMLC